MSDIKFCPKCGAPLGPGTKFCPKCGYKIVNMTVNEAANIHSEETKFAGADDDNDTKTVSVNTDIDPADVLQRGKTGTASEKARHPKPDNNKSNKRLIWIVLAVCAVVGVIAGIYFGRHSSRSSYNDDDIDYKEEDTDTTEAAVEEAEAVAPAAEEAAPAAESAEYYESPELIKYRKNFNSKDLILCDMHGRVSYATLYDNGRVVERYDFTRDGMFTYNSDTHNANNIYRDGKGRVTGERSSRGEISYGWGSNGLVNDVYHPVRGHMHYIYDSKGELHGIEYNDGSVSRTEYYRDYDYDPYLNWRRRTRVSPDGSTSVQTRSIVYYDPE